MMNLIFDISKFRRIILAALIIFGFWSPCSALKVKYKATQSSTYLSEKSITAKELFENEYFPYKNNFYSRKSLINQFNTSDIIGAITSNDIINGMVIFDNDQDRQNYVTEFENALNNGFYTKGKS